MALLHRCPWTVTHHHCVPVVAAGIAAQKRKAQALFHDDVFAVAQLVAVLDVIALEGAQVFVSRWPVVEHGGEGEVAIVQPWC